MFSFFFRQVGYVSFRRVLRREGFECLTWYLKIFQWDRCCFQIWDANFALQAVFFEPMTESPIWTKDYFEKYTDTWKLNRERAMPVVPERPTIPFVTQAKTSISGSFQERGILQNVALIQKTWVELSWMIKVILKLFITNIGWTCMNILPDFRTILNISSWMIMFHDILKTCGVLTTLLMCTCKKENYLTVTS